MKSRIGRPWLGIVLATLCATLVACSSGSPAASSEAAADSPPEDEWVSNATSCLGNGTVHDPNPAGCGYSTECRRTPNSQPGEWANHWLKSECSNIDWMTGISTDGSMRDHNLLCATTSYSNLTGGSIAAASCTVVWATAASTTYPASGGLMSSDWDPSTAAAPIAKLECPGNSHVSGYARDGAGNVASILCCTIAGETQKTGCSPQTYGKGVLDARESTLTGEWDSGFTMLECGTGRAIGGLSTVADGGWDGKAINQGAKLGRVHGILCCDASPAFNAQSTYNANPIACAANNDCKVAPTTCDTGDWAHGYVKFECAETDVMTGISQEATQGLLRQHHCALSTYKSPGGGNAAVPGGNFSVQSVYNGSYPNSLVPYDWDPGYEKMQCPAGLHVAGISVSKGMQAVHNILCAPFPGESAQTNCRPQMPFYTKSWSSGIPAAECKEGEVLSGVSVFPGSHALRLVLCCQSIPTQAYSACCNDTTFKASVSSCLTNATKNVAACNVADYCCQDGVSTHAGSKDCEEVALAEDPSGEGDNGLDGTPSSLPQPESAECGLGAPEWSFSFTRSKVRGNKNFGTRYELTRLASADGMRNASGEAKMKVDASLFWGRVPAVAFDAKAIHHADGSNTTRIGVRALDLDIAGTPFEGTSPLVRQQSWTLPLVHSKKNYLVGGLYTEVNVGLVGDWGFNDSLDASAAALNVNAAHWCNLNATASASYGVGIPGFASTSVGVEGSLAFVALRDDAVLRLSMADMTVDGSPAASLLHYDATGTLTVTDVNGKMSVFAKAQLLWFKKKWTQTIARFAPVWDNAPYLDHHGCVPLN